MLISSKVSHSVLTFLESKGVSTERLLDRLLDHAELSMEFARDPSSWVDARQMEAFLEEMEERFPEFSEDEVSLSEVVGRACSGLRAWGVLDSVLKMMTSAPEILAQPDRFLSYFISPSPPVGSLQRTASSLSFEVPISSEEYPRVTCLLKGVFAGLPGFFGAPLAEAQWQGTVIKITWSSEQESLFSHEDPGHNMKPEFLQELVASLEKNQKDLEEKNRELLLKNQQLERAQKELQARIYDGVHDLQAGKVAPIAKGVADEMEEPVSHIQRDLQRLQDYMIRAQQLVTLLVKERGLDKKVHRQLEHVMQRLDWQYVVREFPSVISDSFLNLQRIQDVVSDFSSFADTTELQSAQKREVDLNQVVEKAMQAVQSKVSGQIRLDRHLLLDRTVTIDPAKMKEALVSFINHSVQSIEGEGCVRIITRPKGPQAEIEISDTGVGMDSEALQNIFTPFYAARAKNKNSGLGLSLARSIVKMHNGDVVVSSEVGRGSTFLINLPN